jgi:DNA-binding response OmpR family regulator
LLQLLIVSAPRVVSRDEILDALWGEDKFPNHRTVDNMIVRLRQSLGDEEGRFIRSVRGIGYQWNEAGRIKKKFYEQSEVSKCATAPAHKRSRPSG